MQDRALGPDDVDAVVARAPDAIEGDRLPGQFLATLKGCAIVEPVNAFAAHGVDMLDIFAPESKQIMDGIGLTVFPGLAVPKQHASPPPRI